MPGRICGNRRTSSTRSRRTRRLADVKPCGLPPRSPTADYFNTPSASRVSSPSDHAWNGQPRRHGRASLENPESDIAALRQPSRLSWLSSTRVRRCIGVEVKGIVGAGRDGPFVDQCAAPGEPAAATRTDSLPSGTLVRRKAGRVSLVPKLPLGNEGRLGVDADAFRGGSEGGGGHWVGKQTDSRADRADAPGGDNGFFASA
jgi:hypothetical protein